MIRQHPIVLLVLLLTPAMLARAERTVSTGLLAKGAKWQTPYFINDTGIEGPTLLIVGGMHGNEPAGFRSASQIRHWPIVKGKLIVIPRANTLGLKANIRYVPDADKANRDLNRNFPGTKESKSARGPLAQSIWAFVLKQKPDWVLDLHEGYQFNVSHKPEKGKKKSVGSTIICHPEESVMALAKRMLKSANETVTDEERRFVLLPRGPVSTGLINAAVRKLGCQGMILETTSQFQPLSVRTRQHRRMVSVLMQHLGIIDREHSNTLADSGRKRRMAVALFDGTGTGVGGVTTLTRILDRAPSMSVHHVGPAEMTQKTLSQFDVVLCPGGSGSKQAAAIGKPGRDAIKQFIHGGGGYLGICAGAYLCSSHYSWSLDVVGTSVFTGSREIEGVGKKQMWYRGKSSQVQMELTAEGKKIFPNVPMKTKVRYQNGPVVSRNKDTPLQPYKVLAWFRSEVVLYPPQKGTMVNTPAIITGDFGQGRVVAISPHPESTDGLESMVTAAINHLNSSK